MTDFRDECLDRHKGNCEGLTLLRESLSGTGVPIPRCELHWEERLEEQEEINRKYAPNSDVPPADFDPSYAGERWEEE